MTSVYTFLLFFSFSYKEDEEEFYIQLLLLGKKIG
jgi:hypothetical protein